MCRPLSSSFALISFYPVKPFGGSECGLHLVPLADSPLLVLSVEVVFIILERSSKRVVMTDDMTTLENYAYPH